MRQIIKRAALLFLIPLCAVAASIGAVLWYHIRIANPCSADDMLNGEPATCYYRVQPTGLGDWPWILAMLLVYSAVCVLVSWLSLRRRQPHKAG